MVDIKRALDATNKQVQFEISDTCNSINFKFQADGLTDAELSAAVGEMYVTVELISKSEPNRVLYASKYSDLKKIVKFAYPGIDMLLPFAVSGSVSLNDDSRLLVTFDYQNGAVDPKGFSYSINKHVEIAKRPLIIKKVEIAEEADLSTENYPLLLLDDKVESYETVVVVADGFGGYRTDKVLFGKAYVKSKIQPGKNFLEVVVAENQKVKIVGNTTIYLLLI